MEPPNFTIVPTNTWTPTNSPTPTGTISPTPTPLCPGAPNVTANIDGTDYIGSDVGKTIPGFFNLDHGGTSVGDILTLTLASPMTLNISLCTTEQLGRKMALYLRPSCANANLEFFNGGFCAGLPELTSVSLTAGTYYILLAENPGTSTPSGGVYTLRIKSGSTSSNVCGPSTGVVPEVIPCLSFGSCSNYYQMNGNPPVGNYGAPFSGTRVATGSVDESKSIANTDDFLSFTPMVSGPVTVTLDCFDNGLSVNDFDIYCAATCPTDKTVPPYVGFSNTTNPIEKFVFTGAGGTTYYLDIQAFQGTGSYRITIQTP